MKPKTSEIFVSCFRTKRDHRWKQSLDRDIHYRARVEARAKNSVACVSPGGVTWVNFCWVCAAGLSEPLPHYSLFSWPIIDPILVTFGLM